MSQSETPPPDQSPDHRAPLILWRAAQAFLAIVFDLFGAPEQLAARHTLTLKDHQLCAQWLRAAEALMRRMLFIEAALVELGPPASSRQNDSAGKMPAPRPRQLIGFDADHPEAWRVSFRCFNPDRRLPAGKKKCRQDAGAPKFCSAWPMAERFEAMLRVCNNPAPFAKRLAARLRKAPALVQRLCASAWTEFRDTIGHTLHDVLAKPIANAAAVFRDSS